jgi:hypothetical protein
MLQRGLTARNVQEAHAVDPCGVADERRVYGAGLHKRVTDTAASVANAAASVANAAGLWGRVRSSRRRLHSCQKWPQRCARETQTERRR